MRRKRSTMYMEFHARDGIVEFASPESIFSKELVTDPNYKRERLLTKRLAYKVLQGTGDFIGSEPDFADYLPDGKNAGEWVPESMSFFENGFGLTLQPHCHPGNRVFLCEYMNVFEKDEDGLYISAGSFRFLEEITKDNCIDPRIYIRITKLENADLCGLDLSDADFTDTTLHNVNLNYATLKEAILHGINMTNGSFVKANFYRATLDLSNISNANFQEANLSEATLVETFADNVNFTKANLSWTDLTKARFRNAKLRMAELSKSVLKDADFINADFTGACLYSADLSGANLTGANLQGTNLEGANLKKTILTGANLHGIDIKKLKKQGAIL